MDCVGQEDQLLTGPGHLGDVGVLSPRAKKKLPGLMKMDPEKFKPDLQWMSSSPKGGVCGHGSDLDLS